jgi:fructokinase
MVIAAGESLVDLIADGDAIAARPGGAPFNVARGVARLGTPAAFLGALSSDAFGRELRAALEADGVDVALAPEVAAPTTLALARLAGGDAQYTFYVEGTSAPALTADDAGRALAAGPRAIHVGGLGLVLEPCASAVEHLVASAPDDVLVTVDPNVRPALPVDPGRLRRVLERADLVKVSTEDLEHLGSLELRGPRTRAVLVTDGSRPVRVDGVEVEVPAVEVVDTVGAGDAFCAGLLHATLRGDGPLEAAAFAGRVAAVACTRAGADPPTAAEVR